MNTAPVDKQQLNAYYEGLFTRYLSSERHVPPPAGWQKVWFKAAEDAIRVNANEEDSFMGELLGLIREQCSNAPPDECQQFRKITFDGSEIVARHLGTSTLTAYRATADRVSRVWIEIAPKARSFARGYFS